MRFILCKVYRNTVDVMRRSNGAKDQVLLLAEEKFGLEIIEYKNYPCAHRPRKHKDRTLLFSHAGVDRTPPVTSG